MSHQYPSELKYSKDHEWALFSGDTITVGITDHAQDALGEIVFLELPAVGRDLKKGETLGVVESIKAVSDIYAPATGQVIETHKELTDNPGQINGDPYKQGWLLKMKITDKSSLDHLMDRDAYVKYVESLK